jgi:DNA-binding NarL/FixJ family response regulator
VTRVRVLLADDHPVVRAGLAGMLSTEPDSTRSAGPATARRCSPWPGYCALPRADGPPHATTGRRRRHGPDRRREARCGVLVLTTFDTDGDILRAVEAGATGYLLEDAPRAQLADAVRPAARGETVLAPPVAAKLVTKRQGGR